MKIKQMAVVSLLVISLMVLSVASFGCSASDPLTESIYTTNIYNAEELATGSISYTDDCWEEIVVPANAVAVLPGEAPNDSNCQSGFVYLYADYALPVDEQYVHFTVEMPHSYKEGTDIIFNVRFVFNGDEVGTYIRWNIAYSWANIGEDFLVSTHIWALSDPSNNDGLAHRVTKFAPVSGAGKEMGSILMCYLSRNSSSALDTYTDTAVFVAVSVLYQVDTPGSESEWSK